MARRASRTLGPRGCIAGVAFRGTDHGQDERRVKEDAGLSSVANRQEATRQSLKAWCGCVASNRGHPSSGLRWTHLVPARD